MKTGQPWDYWAPPVCPPGLCFVVDLGLDRLCPVQVIRQLGSKVSVDPEAGSAVLLSPI